MISDYTPLKKISEWIEKDNHVRAYFKLSSEKDCYELRLARNGDNDEVEYVLIEIPIISNKDLI